MTSVVILIGGALVNALAFTGCSYMFLRLSKDGIGKERKRHDLAIEQLQKAQNGHRNNKKGSTLSTNNSGWSEKLKPNSQS